MGQGMAETQVVAQNNTCAKWTVGIGTTGAIIMAIVFAASFASVVSAASTCVSNCNCDKEATVLGGSAIGVLVGFYAFWPFLITAIVGCCCLCCNQQPTTVTTVYDQPYAAIPPGGYVQQQPGYVQP